MYAVVSDIHSNLEALDAVMADIRKRNIERIVCLGDVVGYGPNPRECIDIARDFDLTLMGNHDQAALFEQEAVFFNDKARLALEWTRDELERDSGHGGSSRWDFLGSLPNRYIEDNILMVHGSPRKPIKEYVFPDVIITPNRLSAMFELVDHVCFDGHTHIPGVITEENEYFSPVMLGNFYEISEKKVIVNFGSVGQPRDGLPTASYGLFDGKRVAFVRVPYEVQTTVSKIYAARELDNELGDRLIEGR